MDFLEYCKKHRVEIIIFYRAVDDCYIFSVYYHDGSYRCAINISAKDLPDESDRPKLEKYIINQADRKYSLWKNYQDREMI